MKRKRRRRAGAGAGTILALMLALCLGLAGGGAAETAAEKEKLTGYFPERVYARPVMEMTTEYVDTIPAFTVVTLEKRDGIWAEWHASDGRTGYVRYGKIQPVPEYEADPEKYIYGEKRVEIRGLPIYEAPVIYRAEPCELLTVDGHVKGFPHVRTEDGTEGYILPYGVREANFTPKPISPVTVCVGEETKLTDFPLRGAHPMGTLTPDRFYTVEAASGDYYALTLEGRTVYAEKAAFALCGTQEGEERIFFSLPKGTRGKRRGGIETVFRRGLVKAEGAELLRPGEESLQLPGNAQIYIYAGYGAWLGVTWGTEMGYLRREEAEVLEGAAVMARLREADLSGGKIARSDLLDQGFALVEDGNPFQARYNLLTGAETRSILPLGVPYFWGGRNYRTVTERLPEYTTRAAWQSSPVFYQKGTIYLYGFDCIGLVKSVYARAGREIEGTLVGRRDAEYCAAGRHVYCDNVHPLPEDWTEAARGMQVGDIMIIHHPGTHALMYMGTLRDYGYTAEQLPALANYLDYPLMLQSGANPYSYLRFQSYIESSGDSRVAAASPPDGSACVCILGVPRKDAEIILTCHDETYYGFDVEGSCVTITGFGNVTDYFVYRPGDAEPSGPADGTEDGTETAGSEDDLEAAGDERSRDAGPEDGTESIGSEDDPEAAGDERPREEDS